jgi:hypothetical protein
MLSAKSSRFFDGRASKSFLDKFSALRERWLSYRRVVGLAGLAFVGTLSVSQLAAAQTYEILHRSFDLYGRPLLTSDGKLFVTACGGSGGAFSLIPPAPPRVAWSMIRLDLNGCAWGGLIADGQGAVYGTAATGESGGDVFKFVPPPRGQSIWKKQVIYSFRGAVDPAASGFIPYGTVFRDLTGALYGFVFFGGAHGAGGIYKLTPPAAGSTAWTEALIYSFTHPGAGASREPIPTDAPLIRDQTGALYSRDTYGGAKHFGTIIKLSPPASVSGKWTSTVLYEFAGGADGQLPVGGLVMDANRNLYGSTFAGGAGGGTIYKLVPPAAGKTAWSHTILFVPPAEPKGGLVSSLLLGRTGGIFGTNLSANTLFKLSPPKAGTKWNETVLHKFTPRGGNLPYSGVIQDSSGALYGTTSGTDFSGLSVVYKLTP